MKKINLNLFMLGMLISAITLFGCGGGSVSDTTATGAAIDGTALYNGDCSSCHGAIAKSGKRGVSVSQIQDAIAHNWGGMGAFAGLTANQLQAIASALSDPATLTGDTTTPVASTDSQDGAALYTQYCQGCHGALASSAKKGRTATQITAAIGSVGPMSHLSTLSQTQINAIASALRAASGSGGTTASTEGAALYTQYCSGCHGALASSAKAGRTAAQIQTAIGTVSQMSSLAVLTTTQIQAIAAALSTSSGTSTPPACGSCHTIPPATGHHATHVLEENFSCSVCHGAGYSPSTVNSATHMNGVVNITSTIGWNPTARTCSNSCHGTHSW